MANFKTSLVFGISLFLVSIGGTVSSETPRIVEDTHHESRGDAIASPSPASLIQLRIATDDGQVQWTDVYRSVAGAVQLNESVFASQLPSGSIDLNRPSARAVLFAANLAIPGLKMRRDRDDANGGTELIVTIDRDRLKSEWRQAKGRLRRQVTGAADGTSARYELAVDKSWASADVDITRVVLLHGFNSAPHRMQPLAAQLRRQGHPCAIATYPNDQAIEQSARWLGKELRALGAMTGKSRVALVAHSMGGLVARRMLEDPQLDPGQVDRLVMLAPPNHGTSLARIALGADVWEHWLRDLEHGIPSRFFRSIDDGLAEAAHDLRPDSLFLRQLNARQRNPRVSYTIVLGNAGVFSEREFQKLQITTRELADRSQWTRLLSPRIESLLADLDEVVEGKGDGVVSLKRGQLAGVDDVHVLAGDHHAYRHLSDDAGKQLLEIVVQRLK